MLLNDVRVILETFRIKRWPPCQLRPAAMFVPIGRMVAERV